MKTVLITGCSSGFGLTMTHLFLKKGWIVIAGFRKLDDSSELLKTSKPNLHPISLDVTKEEDIKALAELLKTKFANRLDCLINNAGFAVIGPFESASKDNLRAQMETNFFGLAFLTKICLPALRQTKGRIINISSCFGFVGLPFSSLYCASKFAVEGLTESLFYELNPLGIQVSLVEPSLHQSNFLKNIITLNQNEIESYHTQQKNLNEIFEAMSSKKASSPEKVANKVYQLVCREKMPLRVRVGLKSHLLYYFKKLLPQNLCNSLFGTIYNQLLLKK